MYLTNLPTRRLLPGCLWTGWAQISRSHPPDKRTPKRGQQIGVARVGRSSHHQHPLRWDQPAGIPPSVLLRSVTVGGFFFFVCLLMNEYPS